MGKKLSASELLHECLLQGLRLSVENGRLAVRGNKRVIDCLAEQIREHRDALIALLSENWRGPVDVEIAIEDPYDHPYLGNALTLVIEKLFKAGCNLRGFPAPTIVAMDCPQCRTGIIEVTGNDNRTVAVIMRCDCGPARLMQLLRGHPATIYYKQPKKRPAEDKCFGCGESNWWHSIYGLRLCRTCHPPAHPDWELHN